MRSAPLLRSRGGALRKGGRSVQSAKNQDLLQMFLGEKAKAFRVLQSLSFTATNLDGKMSLKIDSKENSLKTLADLFVALR